MSEQEIPKCKIGVVGESGVGKTSLLVRWTDDKFFTSDAEINKITLGLDYKIKNLVIQNTPVKLHIYDTAGQERFRNITAHFYRGSNAILLVFDLTEERSFSSLSEWLREIKTFAPENMPIVLVGNKLDLIEKNTKKRAVEKSVAEKYAETNGLIGYFETSAAENTNVNNLFDAIANKSFKHRMSRKVSDPKIKPGESKPTGKKSCCKS